MLCGLRLRLAVLKKAHRSDGNLRQGSRVQHGSELPPPRLPGANQRDKRVGVGFWVFALPGGVGLFCEA